MRAWMSALFTAAALLLPSGCGGSGSSPAIPVVQPEQHQAISLGFVRGDATSDIAVVVTKPFAEAGTVDLAGIPDGPFAPVAGVFPAAVAPGERVALWINFAPPASAANLVQNGTVPLVFRPAAGGDTYPVTLHIDAEIERPSARLLQTQVLLGSVPLGETVACGVLFENTSVVTPVSVSHMSLSEGEFAFAPDASAVPALVAPGATFLVRMSYTPRGETLASSLLRVFHSASAQPLEADLGARGIPAQIVHDFGAVALDPDTGLTGWLTIDLGPEAVGIFLEAWGDPYHFVDLAGLEGPGGKVYETEGLTGPLDWMSGYPAGLHGYLNVQVPDSSDPAAQLEEGGGTYRFRLRHEAPGATAIMVRATITQRRYGKATDGTLDLRIFLAKGLSIVDPDDPMRDTKFVNVLKTIDAVLGMRGIRLGKITFAPVMEPVFDVIPSEEEAERLIVLHSPMPPEIRALNLLFVKDLSYGVSGMAGASPGPSSHGMPWAGVVTAYDSAQASVIGVIAAHQIGHYLGWFGETVLPDPQEAKVMLGHPIVNPGLPEENLSSPATDQAAQATAASMPPATTWCGTCARPPVR